MTIGGQIGRHPTVPLQLTHIRLVTICYGVGRGVVENIWCLDAGKSSSRPVRYTNLATSPSFNILGIR